jgi:hypothetical protein
MVRREQGAILVPITSQPVAELFRRTGWQVTELPLSAFTLAELQSLRVIPDPRWSASP